MFHFLESDIREQKKYERRIQTSVDNTVNDLRYESSLKIFQILETLLFLFKQKTKIYFILGDAFFKITKNLILGIY